MRCECMHAMPRKYLRISTTPTCAYGVQSNKIIFTQRQNEWNKTQRRSSEKEQRRKNGKLTHGQKNTRQVNKDFDGSIFSFVCVFVSLSKWHNYATCSCFVFTQSSSSLEYKSFILSSESKCLPTPADNSQMAQKLSQKSRTICLVLVALIEYGLRYCRSLVFHFK